MNGLSKANKSRRLRFLLIRGVLAAAVYWAISLILTDVLLRVVGYLNVIACLAAVEAGFYVFWLWRTAFLNAIPDRHEPDEHDAAASFERFKALTLTENAQVSKRILLAISKCIKTRNACTRLQILEISRVGDREWLAAYAAVGRLPKSRTLDNIGPGHWAIKPYNYHTGLRNPKASFCLSDLSCVLSRSVSVATRSRSVKFVNHK